jgi:Fibronectin type III domain/CHAP domain
VPSKLIRRILVVLAAAACFAMLAITQSGRSAPAGEQLTAAHLPAPGLGTGTGYCTAYPGGAATKYNLDNVYACDGSATGSTTFDQPGKGEYAWQCVELSARFLWAVYRIWAGPTSGVQDGADLVSVVHANNKQVPVATSGPASVPGVGDVISLGPGGGSDPTYGHTAVVVGANPVTGQFTIMSENDPVGAAGEQTLRVDLSGGHNGQVLYHNHWTTASWLVLSPVTLPAQPMSPHVTSTTGTSAALAWTEPASNETSYVSQYRVVGTSSWNAGPSVGASATAMTVAGLKVGTKYTFQVGARNAKGTHWSVYFPGSTVALPNEPTSVNAKTSATSAVLTWTDNSDNETSFVSQYQVTGSGTWIAGPSAGANSTTMTITGLTPDTKYTFQVGARNVAGTHWSAYATGNTPQALPAQPASPRVTSATGTSEVLTWTDASDNETRFVSQYRLVGGGSWKAGPSVGANVTSMTVTGLSTGTEYTFQVGAQNSVGTHWSAYFNGWTQALPAEPTGASASMSSTSAALTWTDNSDNETSFVTQYQPTGSGTWIAGPSVGANVTSVTVNGLTPDTKYTFQVGARNSVGTHWSAYVYGSTTAQPAYNTGRQVTIASQATGGVSGHTGPGNSYATGPTHPANSALWIVCYVNGQSITGPYDTTAIWDLGDDGYYYTDAWLYTGTNGPAVPACAMKTVTVDSHATGGVSGHTGPGNSYAAGPTHAANSPITLVCYVTGQSITGPYDTTTIWDLADDGYYYTDAWLYTGINGPAVPAC